MAGKRKPVYQINLKYSDRYFSGQTYLYFMVKELLAHDKYLEERNKHQQCKNNHWSEMESVGKLV